MKRLTAVLLAFIALVALRSSVSAAEIPKNPILRIETGEQLLPRSLAAANGVVATAGRDKTIRIWDEQGKLLRTLRPPIDDATDEGTFFAVDLSPDGREVAGAGATGCSWDRNCSIYIFDTESGIMKRRVAGLSSPVQALRWSPDGRWIVARHLDRLLLIDAVMAKVVDQHIDYRFLPAGIDIAADGSVVTASYDNYLRLYAPVSTGKLRLLIKKPISDLGGFGLRPKFSPDGQLIAVTNYDRGIKVVSRADLSTVYNLTWPNNIAGAQPRIEWSQNQRYIFAAGDCSIIRWSDAGRGAPAVARPNMCGGMSIVELKSGRLAVQNSQYGWAFLNSDLTLDQQHPEPRPTFTMAVQGRSPGGLAVSQDGSRISFKLSNGKQFVFSVPDQSMAAAAAFPAEDTVVARTSDTNQVRHIFVPRSNNLLEINGNRINLQENSWGQYLGQTYLNDDVFTVNLMKLSRLARDGKVLWSKFSESESIRAFALSGDGRYILAAFDDGSIKWMRSESGEVVANLYVHSDLRWIFWTPSGYYNASAGGEDLLGWQINRGPAEAADFYSASRFRSQLYRPDVISKVISVRNEPEALRIANNEAGRKDQVVRVENVLPPIVEIVSPQEGETVSTSTITVRLALRSPNNAPVTRLRVRVNGQSIAVSDARDVTAAAGQNRVIDVPIPEQDSDILVFAENKNGVSAPGIVRVAWRGTSANSVGDSLAKPKLYVLAVGVSDYQLKDIKLGFAAKDAKDFAAVFAQQKGLLYRDVEMRVLTDTAATRDAVVDGLDWIRRQVTSRDIAILFLAGHGVNDVDGRYYFLPVNADPDGLKRTGVVFSEIRDTLAALPGKAILFIDTCHAGNVLGAGRRAVNVDVASAVNELASAENGVLVFSSSTGRQYSLENTEWGNGAFTKAVVEGLQGRAKFDSSGRITHKMLDLYVSERVKELTDNKQTPVLLVPQGVPDFPIVLAK
jgi:WD40 repeat protein